MMMMGEKVITEEEEKYGGKQSGWKLVEINRKYGGVLKEESRLSSPTTTRRAILDLCAAVAPEEWIKVAVDKAAAMGYFVLGVIPINVPILINLPTTTTINISILQEDNITTPIFSEKIKKVMEEHGLGRGFDLVLHDGAGVPNNNNNSYNALDDQSLKLIVTHFLSPNGTFVTKGGRLSDYVDVLRCIAELFEKLKVEQFDDENYLVCLNYKAPLDHLRKSAVPKRSQAKSDSTRKVTRTRIRNWCRLDDDDKTACLAKKFVWSDDPLKILSSRTHIRFGNADGIEYHKLTTEEVRLACSNIRDISKPRFKLLIKWHAAIRVALTKSKPAPPITKIEPKRKDKRVVKMLRETVESIYDMCLKKNGAEKLIAEQQSKDKSRTAMGMQMDGVVYGCGDQEQVALSSIKGKKDSVDAIDEDFAKELKKSHEHLEDLVDQAYKIFKKRYVSRKRKEKRPKDERHKVTFDDDVTTAYVRSKLFSRCIIDNNADEVENKAKSDSEEKVEKGESVATV